MSDVTDIDVPYNGWRPRPHQDRLWQYLARGGKQVPSAPVVTEPGPCGEHVRLARAGECRHGRKALEESLIKW